MQHSKVKVLLSPSWSTRETDELVLVDQLWRFREFRRAPNLKLRASMEATGLTDSLILDYSVADRAALLVEGNHRLNEAMALGWTHVPVRVCRRDGSLGHDPRRWNQPVPVSGVEPDEYGYVKADLRPSEIGVAGTLPMEVTP